MKNIIKLKNEENINILRYPLDLNGYGLLSYLISEGNNLIAMEDIEKKFGISIKEMTAILKNIGRISGIDLDIKMADDMVMWSIQLENKGLESEVCRVQETSKESNLKFTFKLTNAQENELLKIEDERIAFKRLLVMLDQTYKDFISTHVITIKNEEDYKRYLNETSAITMMLNSHITPTPINLEFLYKELVVKKKDIGLINFLIEYCVRKSTYNNFSLRYAGLISESWEKNKIDTIDQAMKHVKEIEKKKEVGSYVEPDWTEESKSNQIAEEFVDIDSLLEEKGIR